MLDDGMAVELEPVLVTDASQAYGLFGAGSVLADMVTTYRRNDVVGTLWCIPFQRTATDVAANMTDTIDGTAPPRAGGGLHRRRPLRRHHRPGRHRP